jgi:hypothetical protein
MKPYTTSELDVAAYLVAAGHQLRDTRPAGVIVEFVFDNTNNAITEAMESYFAGAALPVAEVFRAHRHLRSLIRQCKQNTTYRIGAATHASHRS